MAWRILKSPFREYVLIAAVALALGLEIISGVFRNFLFLAAFLGALPTIWLALVALKERRVTIDTFNAFAVIASFFAGEVRSSAFIALMLNFAALLDWYTASRAKKAIEELLKLKPQKALREKNGISEEILADQIKVGDILIIKTGARIPADGKIIFGSSQINEASVTGESMPKNKVVGDQALAATLNESGVLKIRVERAGKDSTLERMVALMEEAAKNKSRPEKYADKFAAIFLPVVAAAGLLTYIFTHNVSMVIALFLVACADDMAVAIPLATTAAIGRAARRGVIIKGGEYLEIFSKIKTLVLDKTGTLTYGAISVSGVFVAEGLSAGEFWKAAAIAEKFSEHPIGRAIFYEAAKYFPNPPDPETIQVVKGGGVIAKSGTDEIAVGDEKILEGAGIILGQNLAEQIGAAAQKQKAKAFVFINKKLAGAIFLADTPRSEAKESIAELKKIGVERVIMFTGDNALVAKEISSQLGISEFLASMSPEDKLRELEKLEKSGAFLGMVGDGINDAPALSRADVGIAMGKAGTAVAVEAADIVILTDNLMRIPEMILLGRKTFSVIKTDIIIWFFSNIFGFTLVLTGVFGPALAAFYNFATDFFPLINSARLFKEKIKN